MRSYGTIPHWGGDRYPDHLSLYCRYGFTLLELLIVLLIMGIAAGITGVIISKSSGGLETRKAAQEVSASLRFARSRAISEKKKYYFVVNNVSRTYGLYNRSFDGNYDLEHLKLLKRLPQDLWQVKFNETVPELFQIEFTPQGSSSGGVIEIRDDRRRYVISVNRLTGRVRIEKKDVS
jgi:general secretion pathway protein H